MNLEEAIIHLDVKLPDKITKKFIEYMKEKTIICGIHYDTLHNNPIYNNSSSFHTLFSKSENNKVLFCISLVDLITCSFDTSSLSVQYLVVPSVI